MSAKSRRSFVRKIFLGAKSFLPAVEAHTLVCIFLRGGADTLNLVVPYGDDDYYRLRPTLSIARPSSGNKESAIKLDDFYGFHPKLEPLYSVFEEGRLGIVQAVGSDNLTGSHFEAQDQIEHGESYGKTIGGGWLGRHLRFRAGAESSPLSAVAIGPTITESLRGAPSASAINSLDEVHIDSPSGDQQRIMQTLSSMYSAEVGLLSQPGKVTLDLLKRVESIKSRDYKTADGVAYPDDEFGRGLREIARLVKADIGLEAACIDLGGWDTHFFQGTTEGLQATSIDQLGRGLAAFDADLVNHRDRVTTIVMTEFGRRIYENGSLGTDHGRGFALMAIGNRIDGGKIHGHWPGLAEADKEILGPGGLKVVYDYRSVLAELLAGIMRSDVSKVFPDFEPQTVSLVKAARPA
jgi:uncharacterized protein (DUF1501 family)